MDYLSGYAHRPLPFVLRYLRRRLASHVVIVASVTAAVACSAGTRGATIAFNNISFDYPGGLRVFDKFSLRLKPGQRVGLVGHSGGGKSSLFVLLQRFYDVGEGNITIDGQDISPGSRSKACARRSRWCRRTSPCSTARSWKISGTAARTPPTTRCCARRSRRAAISSRRCRRASRPWSATAGVKLSGGQRQRIAIARAFLKDAPILLLDEATAALDSESEEAIREALSRLMRGCTVIAIANRLATLRNFDRVVVLKAGRIIEDGPPDRLMQGRGPYRELVVQEMSRLAQHAA